MRKIISILIVAIMTLTVLGVVHFPQSQSTVSATASAYPAFNQISMLSTDSVDPYGNGAG